MNYYERHLGDYAKDTAHLTMIEHGAYSLLLDRYYGTEQGIPADQAHRVARARTREEKQSVDAVLDEFFTLVDGVWINPRAEEEIAKAQAKIKAAQENGKRGGRPKKNPSGSKSGTQEKPGGFSGESEGVPSPRDFSPKKLSGAQQQKSYAQTQESDKKNNEINAGVKPGGFSMGSETGTQEKAHQTPSTNIKPSSTQAASTVQTESCTRPPAAADSPPDPIQARSIELAILLRQRGAALQSSDPRVREWARTGVTDAQALAALETAQQRRAEQGNHQPINAGYLDAILKHATDTGTPTRRKGSIHDERAATIAGLTGRDRKPDDGQTIDGSAIVVD